MANKLPIEKKVTVISMLAEGSSIRSVERITGVNRNTIMSLSLRVGKACARILDEKMRGLNCRNIEVDEIWGFIGKKEKRATRKESMIIGVGDVNVCCAQVDVREIRFGFSTMRPVSSS